jgi:microcystin-dependent protein
MEPLLGQIQPFGFNFAPRGWAKCDGTLLSIAANSALFSLLGTTFGGDGVTTFALPDLRGRSIVHIGQGPGLDTITWGERGGRTEATITQANMPSHSHALVNGVANVTVYTTDGSLLNETSGGANGLGTGGSMPEIYAESPTTADHLGGVIISGTTTAAGGNIPLDISNPFLGINTCIAHVGVFPSRN